MRDRPHIIPCVLAAAGLILAVVTRQPYYFYQDLRVVVAAAAFWAFGCLSRDLPSGGSRGTPLTWWRSLLLGIIVLFNPLWPVHLSASAWHVLDILTAAAMVAFGVQPAPPPYDREKAYFKDPSPPDP